MKQFFLAKGRFGFFVLLSILFLSGAAEAALEKGTVAPPFKGLEAVQKKPMVIVYFFKVTSKPSMEGLDNLTDLFGQSKNEGIAIIAVSQDDPKKLDAYIKDHPVPFLMVRDDGTLFEKYQTKIILPTTYILGPGARISDVLEGGGSSSYHFMTTIAERTLQLKKTVLAKALFQTALKSNPKNTAAKSGLGYAYLKEGKLDRAEAAFSEIAQLKSPEALLGKEGLAEIYLQKGEPEKALAVAKEIEKEDPNNGLVHLVRGNVLAGQGNQEASLTEFIRATEGKLSTDWQKALAYNSVGRIRSEQGNYPVAEKMYQEAAMHNPFSSEILTNQGVLYEKQGQPQKAFALYQEALSADPEDEISNVMVKRMEQHLAFKEDMEYQKQVNLLVSDLSDRFKKGSLSNAPVVDPWSSMPMTVAFLGIKMSEGSLLREGVSDVLQQEITQKFLSIGRISVVEREILDKILTELKIGTSELADPETALRLGKLLSARLVITGNLAQTVKGIHLSLRAIDPETSAIKIAYSNDIGPTQAFTDFAHQTADVLQMKIKEQYPLRGKVISVEGADRVSVNLGIRHGIKHGTQLKIIEEGDPIIVDGKTIGRQKQTVGVLDIVEVEEAISSGNVKERNPALKVKKDQKVFEE